MAGWPLEELGGKTTLEAADTPVMDRLAEKAEIGMASMVPEDMAPGSDTANLSVMGYDPKIYYTGRSPWSAEYRRGHGGRRCVLSVQSGHPVRERRQI